MRKYESYQDSGIEWIGEIPSHWKVKRGDGLFNLKKNLRKKDDLNGLEIYHYSIPAIQEFGHSIIEDGTTVDSDKYEVSGNEILFSKLNPRKGTVALSSAHDKLAVASTEFVILEPIVDDINFCFYCVSSEGFKAYISSLVESATKSHQRANPSDIYKGKFPIPPLPEQTAIANYLDSKTAEIDQLIADKKRLLELYEEEKTTIINQAVTKGLDPNVSMKDSGIEWLGEIPEHWEVKRLKYLAMINPGKDMSFRDCDDEVAFLPMEKVSETGEIDCKIKRPISELWNGFTYFERNDIIVAKITPCFENGKGAILNDLETHIGFGSTEFHVLRARSGILPTYLYYITRSQLFMKFGEAFMTGAAGQKRVPTSFIQDFIFPLPSLNEQMQIVDHINLTLITVQLKKEKTQKLIDLLTEYRTALISEVVTGKIKVTA